MVNYVALMLVNLTAGFFLLAYFIADGIGREEQRPWVPPFLAVGLVQLATGLHMIFRWPLPGSYNIAFGETSVFFGIIFLVGALALWMGWDPLSVGIYAVFPGLEAIVVGVSILTLGLTRTPMLSGVGFILSGLVAVALPVVIWLHQNRPLRYVAALVAIAAGLIWAFEGYLAVWEHMSEFLKFVPK